MGDPLDPSDFLAAALRQSRAAVADDGFSRRVARRAVAERRRLRWARALPAAMAALGIALASILTGATAIHFRGSLPELGSLEAMTRALEPVFSVSARFGLQPWMLLSALAALLYSLLPGRDESRSAFRF